MKLEIFDNSIKIQLDSDEVTKFISNSNYPSESGLIDELSKSKSILDSYLSKKLGKARDWVQRANVMIQNREMFGVGKFWMVLYVEDSFRKEFSHMGFSIVRVCKNGEILGFELLDQSGIKVDIT